MQVPKFMFGSHYSTAVGCVAFYLVRMMPFAAVHCDYQVPSEPLFLPP